jgi:acetyl-CoA carboxylase, biotin carboxylase subunit
VPPHYDSLLGKVIVHGSTREEALARMRIALSSFIIEGVHTTIPFLLRRWSSRRSAWRGRR